MDKQNQEYFRKKLIEMREGLISEASKTISGMSSDGNKYPDPTDRASAESERNFELRIRDRERKLLSKIEAALERIEDGSFGICEMCGDDIALARLEARPVTTLCIECKTKEENYEKAKAG
ncbi:MAG: RNA polymerase-binding protein DksA [Thermodesulfobacteriota bacterium]